MVSENERAYSVRRLLRLVKVFLVNLLLLGLLLEGGSIVAYFLKTHEFFYFRNRDRIRIARDEMQKGPAQSNSSEILLDYRLHPYFGYVEMHGNLIDPPKANNLGFDTPYNLPFTKKDRSQFIVAVLGGSVALNYGRWETTNGVLAAQINQVPGLQNRKVVIINLAAGAYKEPQQLLVLSYLLALGQEFDAVINIDGFNEVAISAMNGRAGLDVTMPASFIVKPLVEMAERNPSSPMLALIVDTERAKEQVIRLLDRIDHCRLAVCYTFNWVQLIYWRREYSKKSLQLVGIRDKTSEPGSLFWLTNIEKSENGNHSFTDTATEVWADSSRALKDILRVRGIRYFHFLQPNQYFVTRRQFNESERNIALNENSPFRAGVIAGYPTLISKIPELQASGEQVFNAVDVFDEVKEPVYRDDCCHYNELGNKILAEFVARRVVLGLQRESNIK